MKSKNLLEIHDAEFRKTASDMAKDIVAYAFRNGPIEDIHAEGRVSDEEMKALNKYMVNRVSEVMYLFTRMRGFDLNHLLMFASTTTGDWDDADYSEMDERIEMGRKFAQQIHSA